MTTLDIPPTPKIIPLSRTRSEADWRCPRYRFYSYDFAGTGITNGETSLELWMGTCLHDALAAIATFTQANLPIDIGEISRLAGKQLSDQLLATKPDDPLDFEPTPEQIDFANEQATLLQGMILGFYKHTWPLLLAKFPNILHIEAPVTYLYQNRFLYRAKGDLILSNDLGESCYCEYKSTSSKKDEWIESWEYAVQAHATAKAIEATLGFLPTYTQIVGFYKGYKVKGKVSSPFTYCYMQGQHNPPFTQGKALYDYKIGTRKFPVWELEGGIEKWVDAMPHDILIDQFPLTPPIFLDHDLLDTYFRQASIREEKINIAMNDLKEPADPVKSQYVMDSVFPQHFKECRPAWGTGCSFKKLCHGARPDDPLSAGFILRDRSHDASFAPSTTDESITEISEDFMRK